MAQEIKNTQSHSCNPQELWNEIVATRRGIEELLKQAEQTRELQAAQAALEELQIKTANYTQVIEEMQAPMRAILGDSFFGAEEWQQGFGVYVGAPPVIPQYITEELLESECQLQPGLKVKDSHMLVLVPKTVGDEPYTARKLAEFCEMRAGPRTKFIDTTAWRADWKSMEWSKVAPAESAWILIPKHDPSPFTMNSVFSASGDWRHFRGKSVTDQEKVHTLHYKDCYREAKALELMTAALLSYVVTGNPRMLVGNVYLRCLESGRCGGRVLVGSLDRDGLQIHASLDSPDHTDFHIGRALVRIASP